MDDEVDRQVDIESGRSSDQPGLDDRMSKSSSDITSGEEDQDRPQPVPPIAQADGHDDPTTVQQADHKISDGDAIFDLDFDWDNLMQRFQSDMAQKRKEEEEVMQQLAQLQSVFVISPSCPTTR